MDMFDELYDELKLQMVIGIRRRFIVRWRAKSKRGVHWGVKFGRVGLTLKGVQEVCRFYEIPVRAARELKGLEVERVPDVCSVVVLKVPRAVIKLVCRRLEDDAVVEVIVKDNNKFIIGNEFDVEFCADAYWFRDSSRWPHNLW